MEKESLFISRNNIDVPAGRSQMSKTSLEEIISGILIGYRTSTEMIHAHTSYTIRSEKNVCHNFDLPLCPLGLASPSPGRLY